jgi:hypothetical protein
MACTLHIENPQEALFDAITVTAKCKATGEVGRGKVEKAPLDLASAIVILGEEVVWQRFKAQSAIVWQGAVRPKANGKAPKARDPNKPKSVLEQLEEARLAALAERKAAAAA